ncbi:MAG: acyl-CoA dehydrogenase family protein [Pseudomonadota bacterium]
MSLDFAYSAEDRDFRAMVRAFLAQELPESIRSANRRNSATFVGKEVARQWQAILHAKGWLAYNWPVAWGGTGWTPVQRFIFERECALADAPRLIPMGLRYVGPVIFTFGNAQQQAYFLPRILDGRHYWAQGFSEPGAGSDLASLQCRAEQHGDHYLVNGSKLWTTHAHYADWIFCIVRTAKTGKPQEGISFLLIDLKTPGIRVEPIVTIGGDHEVNQVFFDDVEVPLENLVGEAGRGWEYAKFLLQLERGGASASGMIRRELEHLGTALLSGAGRTDAIARQQLARLEIRLLALEVTELRVMSAMTAGHPPGKESSVLKLAASDLEQDTAQLAMRIAGGQALRAPAQDADADTQPTILMSKYLNSRAASIYGGSNEIQRSIIAAQVLELR